MRNKKGRKQVINNRFAEVPIPQLNRSLFKRQFGHKTTFNEGELIPVHTDEVFAGDTLNGKMSMFLRLTTPITPVMDNLDLDLHAFFVPTRLVWSNYYKMLGAQTNPSDRTDFVVPVLDVSTVAQDSLFDYMGIPTGVAIPEEDRPICLPFRAYNLIWNEWFRDENLQDSVPVMTGDEDDNVSYYNVLRRNKKHDYFTSCLPFAQKGEMVNLPLGTTAQLDINGNYETTPTSTYNSGSPYQYFETYNASGNLRVPRASITHSHSYEKFVLGDGTVDLSGASAITINALREAISIQHILERRARGGTRDVELLQSTYGVSPSDSRMQRPELIGVSRAKLDITTIAQTSESSANSPLGDLAAMGTITANMNFTYSAVENGYIIILASARADLTYWQGMPKMFSKRTFLDVMDPMRANLGEQPVLRKEILLTDDTEYNNEVFGYLPNYDDLRFGRNQLSGRFRPNATDNLDVWHFAEEFSNVAEERPVLSGEFIKQNSPIKRTLAMQDFPDFFGDVFLKVNTYRVLPTHSIPGLRRI